ncbi:ABC transporter permease [Clostridium sp. Marseille-P2415]|uniref:ABC transporter permease n=1 Tax=Clostridium sp. Marseille-P2415 TaxID=1805471 RepID=UPI0009885FAC|nr:ABC transporter permease [Clostridium sp. Marseille-P2415]
MKSNQIVKWISIFVSVAMIVFFFAGFLFAPNDPMESNLLLRYSPSSPEYPFGTDALGRCILSRILYGGWTTLGIVLGGSFIVFFMGTFLGMAVSRVIMKENALIDGLINAVTAIPPIAYLIVFIGAWGSGAKTTLFALTVSYILRYIKLVRTRTDMEMGKAYVMCAIASGASKFRILLIHIFPNLLSEMIRFLSLSCADMILAVTGFSFIGLGLGDNVVDWGSMILDARGALVLHPTMILYPIGAVVLATLCFNILGRQLTKKEAV